MGKQAKAPDYTGAANSQAAQQNALLGQQTQANRPNQTTPFGSSTWTQNPDGSWAQNLSFSPQMQGVFDAQTAMQQGRMNLANGLMPSIENAVNQPFNFNSGDQARQAGEDAYYRRLTSKLNPEWDQREKAMNSQLSSLGVDNPGNYAAQTGYQNFAKSRSDAYGDAADKAIMFGGQEGQRMQQMDLQARSAPLQMANLLAGGQNVGMDTLGMPSFMGAGLGQAPNLLGAALGAGNFSLANAQAQNQLMGSFGQGLGTLGGYALGGPFGGMLGNYLFGAAGGAGGAGGGNIA